MEKSMDKIVALAKSRGFVYPGSRVLASTQIRSRLINRIYTGHFVEVCCLRLLLLSVYPRIYQVILIEKTVFLYAKRFFFYIKYAVSNEKDLTNAFLCCIFVEVTCNKTIPWPSG